jgi:hypothetical protein
MHLRRDVAGFKSRLHLRGWLGSTPAGRRPQIRGFRAGGSPAVASSTPATQLLPPAELPELNDASSFPYCSVSHEMRLRIVRYRTIYGRVDSGERSVGCAYGSWHHGGLKRSRRARTHLSFAKFSFRNQTNGALAVAHVAGIIGTGLAAVSLNDDFSCACRWNNRYTQARR